MAKEKYGGVHSAARIASTMLGSQANVTFRRLISTSAVVAIISAAIGGGVGYSIGNKVAGVTDSGPAATVDEPFAFPAIDVSDCSQATVTTVNPAKPVHWAALGDSYSAGVGGQLSGEEFGREVPNTYSIAAAQQLKTADQLRLHLGISACSGAVINDIIGWRLENGQTERKAIALPADAASVRFVSTTNAPLQAAYNASVATLTLGGNDAGFGRVASTLSNQRSLSCIGPLTKCGLLSDGGLANGPNDSGRTPEEEWTDLEESLSNAYQVIVRLMKFDGQLFVLSYPIPFAEPKISCAAGDAVGTKNMGYMNRFSYRLDQTVERAINDANTKIGEPRVHLIDWRTAAGGEPPISSKFGLDKPVPYNPAGICGDEPMTNSFGPLRTNRTVSDSFHPSPYGINIASCIVAEALARDGKTRGNELSFFTQSRDTCPEIATRQ